MKCTEVWKRVSIRRVKARYHGRCKCSAGVWPGNEIAWDTETRRVVGCQPCDYTGRPPDDWQSPADWRGIDRDDPDLFGGQP
jgi:hypothetical protein